MMIGERCADLIRAGHTGGAARKEVELSPSFA
jgi:hypothetical protein